MTAVLDTEFVNDGGGAVLQSLDNMGVSYEVKKLPFDSAIGWMRDRVVYSAEDTGQVYGISLLSVLCGYVCYVNL